MAGGGFLEDSDRMARFLGRAKRHWQWGRRDGFSRLVEEDQLNPLERVPLAWSKAVWRARHGVAPGTATPVFLVGVQRSGTNMVVQGFERAPEVAVFNENSRRAFRRFQLRDLTTIHTIVERSRHQFVLFKPLCDSHRIGSIVDELGTRNRGRIIWAYRAVDGRARSAVAKFGDVNLRVMREIAEGRAGDRWQAGGLRDERVEQLAALDWDRLTPLDGAALFWWARNSLYFDTGLADRSDVALTSYESAVADPEGTIGALCTFLGFTFRPELVAHIEARHGTDPVRVELDPTVRALCDELHARLEAARAASGQHPPR